MIKDIVVNLAINAKRTVASDYAVSMAAALEAHLTGIAFVYEPVEIGSVFDGAAASFAVNVRQQSEEAAAAAAAQFDEAARRNSLSSECHTLSATTTGAAQTFSRIARCHDLSVVAQPGEDSMTADELILHGALFDSGRPVLIVPYIQKDPFTVNRVMLCWDGSRSATRATADALPLLARAKTVDVVTIAATEQRSELPGADIAHHLARHGLSVQLKRIIAPDVDVPNTILSYAADTSADLVVMGGYGHSRLREFILGGATRGMLEAMTVPTLMSH